jgi:hypothetical protein
MKNEKKTYQSPEVNCVEISVEHGFMISNSADYIDFDECDE